MKINSVLAGNQYLTGLTLFFIGYVLFEVSNQLHADCLPLTMLTLKGTRKYRPQVDESKSMASHSHLLLGCRFHLDGDLAVQDWLLHRAILPWCSRVRIISWSVSTPCGSVTSHLL